MATMHPSLQRKTESTAQTHYPTRPYIINSLFFPRLALSAISVRVRLITRAWGFISRILNSWNLWSQMLKVTSSIMNRMTAWGSSYNFQASIMPLQRPSRALLSGNWNNYINKISPDSLRLSYVFEFVTVTQFLQNVPERGRKWEKGICERRSIHFEAPVLFMVILKSTIT